MVRFRVTPSVFHGARQEHMVEVFVPSEGNDAALFLVFNSEAAAHKAAEFFNYHADLYEMQIRVRDFKRDPQDD